LATSKGALLWCRGAARWTEAGWRTASAGWWTRWQAGCSCSQTRPRALSAERTVYHRLVVATCTLLLSVRNENHEPLLPNMRIHCTGFGARRLRRAGHRGRNRTVAGIWGLLVLRQTPSLACLPACALSAQQLACLRAFEAAFVLTYRQALTAAPRPLAAHLRAHTRYVIRARTKADLPNAEGC
jgi:hypothetical protein